MSGWVDGVHPSRCVEWRWCAAAVVLPSVVVWLVPFSSHCSVGEYCSVCRVLFLAGCVVWCGVGVCLWCLCGGVSSVRSPLVVDGGWGYRGWWGAVVVVGGMVSEGRVL